MLGDTIFIKHKPGFESILSHKAAHQDDFTQLLAQADFQALFTTTDAVSAYVGTNAMQLRRASPIKSLPLFDEIVIADAEVELPTPTIVENVKTDYALTGHTLGAHPMSLLRPELMAIRAKSSREFADLRHGQHIKVIGIVTGRQRPSTAAEVTFVTLEDEYGMINVIVWRDLAGRQRSALMHSRLLQVKGTFEEKVGVRHLIAAHL